MQRRLGRQDETLSTTDGVQLGQQCGHSFVEVRARAAERRHGPCQPRNVPCAQRAHEESEQLERKRGKRDTVPSRHPSVLLVRQACHQNAKTLPRLCRTYSPPDAVAERGSHGRDVRAGHSP